jgi:hypothetical protein
MSKYENANIEKKVKFRKAYEFEIMSMCIFLHFIACCYAATTNLVNIIFGADCHSTIIKFMTCYSISVLGSLILVVLLFTIKFVLIAALKRLYHIRVIYHTWEKNRTLPLTLDELDFLGIYSLEEYFSFLTSYVKSTLISKSSYYSINNKVFLTLEQFFDFEKSVFDLFTLAKRNEDFVVNDESNLSDLKKIEYKKFVNMLKRFNEDSDFNIYFVDNDLNVCIDESKANIFLFDNICVQCYYKEEYQFVNVYIYIKNCLE